MEWPVFEWMHINCFPHLIQLASLLSQKEDSLRNRITKVLLISFAFILSMDAWLLCCAGCCAQVSVLSFLLTKLLVMQFLLNVSKHFGDDYLTHIMLPVFLVAVGDDADFTFFPSTVQSKIRGGDILYLS